MEKPAFRSEINWNTYAIIGGFLLSFAGYAYTTGRVSAKIDTIDDLVTRLASLEKKTARIDIHDIQLMALENRAGDAAAAMQKLQATSNELAGDMKVVREFIQQIRENQNRLPQGR